MAQPSLPQLSEAPQATLRLRLSRAAESHIRAGHPWVFSDSVRGSNRPGERGEFAVIYDRTDRFLAIGLYDPDSPIRVRILHCGKPRAINLPWFEANLGQAIATRVNLFGPLHGEDGGGSVSGERADTRPVEHGAGSESGPCRGSDGAYRLTSPPANARETTGYRMINGESDGWPALVLDRYGGTYVLKLYSAAWLPHLEWLKNLLVRALGPDRIVLRLSRNIQPTAEGDFGAGDGKVLFGSPVEDPPVFVEHGMRFEAHVVHGQKTGFFLDQRDNRLRVGELADGRTVLNAFSFSGGFSLHAARGGAVSVTDVDISRHALESAARNVALNRSEPGVAHCRFEHVQADVFEWLGRKPDRQFDLIVLDPPSLARREAERARAIAAYSRLATSSMRWLTRGGILYVASCSAHVTADEFFQAVREAGRRSRRPFRELETTGHAPDHPATFPQAEYLKGIYLNF